MELSDKEKMIIVTDIANYSYRKELNDNNSLCNKIDFSNTESMKAHKKVALTGFAIGLILVWFIFFYGMGNYADFFDPKYSLFGDFLKDVVGVSARERGTVATFFAIVAIPLAWLFRSVIALGILALMSLLYQKA